MPRAFLCNGKINELYCRITNTVLSCGCRMHLDKRLLFFLKSHIKRVWMNSKPVNASHEAS